LQLRATPKGEEWVLDGTKCFITNGSFAQWYVVFATVDPAERHRGIMAFIVDRETPGLSVGKKEHKMGQRASDTATIIFEEAVVPKKNVLAAPGQGFKLAMQTFDRTRPDIGAIACGVMRRALDESVTYAKERKTFGVPIAEHQMVQAMIADMAMRYEATRLMVLKAAWLIDRGSRSSLVASYSKAFGADSAMQVTTDAVQIFGGNGYMSEYPVEKLMRDAKILQIYEGTSQIQRMVIARNVLAGNR
jgi:acyl-CoA dehydrogenase